MKGYKKSLLGIFLIFASYLSLGYFLYLIVLPKTRQVHIGNDGSAKTILTFEIEPTNNGTHVVQKIRLKPRWYLWPVFYVMWLLFMRKRGQAALDKTVSNVKRVAERSISEQTA